MLDLQFIRDNAEKVRENALKRGADADVDALLKLDEQYRQVKQQLDELRKQMNAGAKSKPSPEEIAKLKDLSSQITELEGKAKDAEASRTAELDKLPNMVLDEVPLGGPELNKVVREVGERREGGVEHWQIPGIDQWLDSESAVRTSGSRFTYIVGDLAKVYYALMRYAQDVALKHGFIPHVPPVLVKREAMYGSGFFPANEAESYRVNADEDDLYLIGTSESVLVSRFADKTVDLTQPLRLTATTTCFRREAGSYGKDTKGLFRLHQFDKIEMVTICKPEDSEAEHQRMLAVEEEVLSNLGLAYRVVLLAAGDAAIQSAKTYDCEAWFAGQQQYRELTSTSTCTDFQARRLKIRFRGQEGTAYAHTLNGTVCSMGRPLACIMEQHQTDTGFTVPEVLRPYCGLSEVRAA